VERDVERNGSRLLLGIVVFWSGAWDAMLPQRFRGNK
jgi:hypothetical protein